MPEIHVFNKYIFCFIVMIKINFSQNTSNFYCNNKPIMLQKSQVHALAAFKHSHPHVYMKEADMRGN